MLAILLAFLAADAVAPAYEKYQTDNETTCIGKADLAFEKADSWAEAGFKFTVSGARAEAHGTAKEARIGLLAAGKDLSDATPNNLKTFAAARKKAGGPALIGDSDS